MRRNLLGWSNPELFCQKLFLIGVLTYKQNDSGQLVAFGHFLASFHYQFFRLLKFFQRNIWIITIIISSQIHWNTQGTLELSDSWHQCYNTLLGNCGRERKTTSQADRQLIRNSKINIRLLAEDLKREMNKSELHVGTVERRLSENGRMAYLYQRKSSFVLLQGWRNACTVLKPKTDSPLNTFFSLMKQSFLVHGHKVYFIRRSGNERHQLTSFNNSHVNR